MKSMEDLAKATLLILSLALTGCDRPNRDTNAPDFNPPNAATQAVTSVVSPAKSREEPRQTADARFEDARLYCLGMILYAEKHENLCPTNLDETLIYLRDGSRVPSGTNHFEILYHGSFYELPNPMTNDGIVILRSDPWQETDGTWKRVYGFADGHCEEHSESDGNFEAWEKQHSLAPD